MASCFLACFKFHYYMITQSNFKNSNRGVSKISTVVSAFSPISSHSNYHLPRREVEDTKLILHLPLLHLELRQLNKITSFRKSPFSICRKLDSGCRNLVILDCSWWQGCGIDSYQRLFFKFEICQLFQI